MKYKSHLVITLITILLLIAYAVSFIYGCWTENWDYASIYIVLEIALVIYAMDTVLFWIFNMKNYSSYEVLKINAFQRCFLIPIYIMVFVIAIIGSVLGIFAIAFWTLCFAIDFIILAVTNISMIPAFCVIIREDIYRNKFLDAVAVIASLFFVCDVVVSIINLVTYKGLNKIDSFNTNHKRTTEFAQAD